MPLLSGNSLWEAFGGRALGTIPFGGADFGECLTTVDRVGDAGTADDWHREWTATAARVEGIADESASRGHSVSAHDAFLRAATYYWTSYFPLFGRPTDPRIVDAFDRSTAAFQRAAALAQDPVLPLEIPFEGGSLPALMVKPDDSEEPRPTIVQTNGYDGTVQEMFFSHGPAGVARGYNVLCFDGPGQGRNLIRDGIPMRPNWETVVEPVVDFALARHDVDPKRVVLVGWSFGGFLAPRAAAFEHRIAALVADPGQWDFIDLLPPDHEAFVAFVSAPDADPDLRWRFVRRGPWVHGVDTVAEYLEAMATFELSPVADQIRCPTLLTQAEGDRTGAGADKLLEAIRAPKVLVQFTEAEGAGGHCEAHARHLYHQRVFDWLDETLS
jgi:dienelactone hydrolase